MSKEAVTEEQRVQCPRDALRRCNHAQPDLCCGGGYNASCDCVCHLWKPIKTAPRDGRDLMGLDPNGEEVGIRWAETRQCMLAGIGGGNGYFGAGWEDTENHLVIHDDMTPTHWRCAT
jgi:hypothetical protein